jgi:omega-6 fatty acid desaturase (delta-12 desaturase)
MTDAWSERLAKFRRPSTVRSLLQLTTTAALFVAVWWVMLRSLQWHYSVTLLLSLVGGALLLRLFIFFHDCTHGSFFEARWANDLVGGVLGVLTLTPYRLWRRTHVLHHASSGNLDHRGFGDVDTLTVDEYRAKSRFGRWCYRVARHPAVFLLLGPPYLFLLKHRLPIGTPLSWRKEWASVLWNNLLLAAVVVVMSRAVGFGNFVSVQAPLFLVSTIPGIWLFHVQHQFDGAYWRRDGEWDFATAAIEGSSLLVLPRPMRWATANIEIHHVHHLCSGIPNYRLRECMESVESLPKPRRMTLLESFRCARFTLFDEASRRMVGFEKVASAS